MDKVKRYYKKVPYYSRKIGSHLLRYLATPFLAVFSTTVFLFVVINYFSTNPSSTNFLPAIEASSLFALFPAILIFTLKTTSSILEALGRNKKINLYFERHRHIVSRISIKTRIWPKPYLLVLAFSMLLLTLAILLKSNQTETAIQLFSFDFVIFMVSMGSSLLLVSAWARCYTPEERAIFLLDRFFRKIDFCLREPKIRLDIEDFRNALKSYQKSLPSLYSLRNLDETVRQTELILSRGETQKILKVQLFVFRLSCSIKTNDASSFHQNFFDFCKFLGENESNEEKILQVNKSRIREYLRINFLTKHIVKLGVSVLLVLIVTFGISYATSKPLSDFAVEILVAVFALFAALESISK
jgi:hypothetical protein